MHLNGKVIVITGGAQGLGLATALRLAPKQPNIALIDTNTKTLAEAKHGRALSGSARVQ